MSTPATILAQLQKRFPTLVIEEKRAPGGGTIIMANGRAVKGPLENIDGDQVDQTDVDRYIQQINEQNLADAPSVPPPAVQ